MFQRFHAMREEREGGFTLIELLVVILIIAILAAIAIPVFLNQRKKGWTSQVQSTLKNAATAQETVLVDTNQYADTVAALQTAGLRFSANDVKFEDGDVDGSGATSYCMKATSQHDATIVYYYDSAVGAPSTAASCTPA
jgi:type IV pilus assembly protein PilA